MAKQAQQTPSQSELAQQLLASIAAPKPEEGSNVLTDVVTNYAAGVLNTGSRIGAALRSAVGTAKQHYELEKTDQMDRQQYLLAKRAEQVAARILARRQ